MLEGSYEFQADGPDFSDSGDQRYAVKAIAWGGTVLSEPPVHKYGIRVELRHASEEEDSEPLAVFSIPLATARELGIWLAEKSDSLAR